METVLWVLLETLRFVGIVQQPITPTIAASLLDQLGVPPSEVSRSFAALTTEQALIGGAPLPEPQIIVPRYERPEEEVAAEAAAAAAAEAAEEAANALSPDELAELETRIKAQGDAVRDAKVLLKGGGGDQDAVDAAVAALLELKGRLPPGHEMLASGKKKKKKKAKK